MLLKLIWKKKELFKKQERQKVIAELEEWVEDTLSIQAFGKTLIEYENIKQNLTNERGGIMMVYKLSYHCSKKRLNDLIHKGLEYEKEHNIEQPEKERLIVKTDIIIAELKKENERLKVS